MNIDIVSKLKDAVLLIPMLIALLLITFAALIIWLLYKIKGEYDHLEVEQG